MSALQFLNKKSWHTATRRNNEKRWLREQEAAKESARIEELQKQLAEERRQEQLHRLEEESGRLDPAAALKRRRLNWMYEYGRDDEALPPPPSSGDTLAADKGVERDDAEARRERKEREDVMLGRKPLNIEEMGEQEREQRATLVDVEAKMREDPIVQFELERARRRSKAGLPTVAAGAYRIARATVGVRKPPRVPDASADEKVRERIRRKEERRRIREERQRRREERVLRKGNHEETSTAIADYSPLQDDKQVRVSKYMEKRAGLDAASHTKDVVVTTAADDDDMDSRSFYSEDEDSLGRLGHHRNHTDRGERRDRNRGNERHHNRHRYDDDERYRSDKRPSRHNVERAYGNLSRRK